MRYNRQRGEKMTKNDEIKKKLTIKKTLALKQEPDEEDLLDLIERLNPNDLRSLYFFIVGILSTRGYEFVD